jgi:hypothetical protein
LHQDNAMTATTALKYLTPAQIAALSPMLKAGLPVHASTVTRWIKQGVRRADGTILRLAAIRYPGGWAIATEALDEFLAALTRDALRESATARRHRSAIGPATEGTRPRRPRAGRGRDLSEADPAASRTQAEGRHEVTTASVRYRTASTSHRQPGRPAVVRTAIDLVML